jgi:hypothetical protein
MEGSLTGKIIAFIFIAMTPPVVINWLAIFGLSVRDEFNRPPRRKKEYRRGDGIVGDSWLLVAIALLIVLTRSVDSGFVHLTDRVEGLESFASDHVLILIIALMYFLAWCWSIFWIARASTPNWQSRWLPLIPRKRVINTLGVLSLGIFIAICIGGMLP